MKAKLENYTGKIIEKPLEAIKEKCLDCSVYDEKEVKLCPCTDCVLWPFRFGNSPYKKRRKLTSEQRKAAAERLDKNKNNSKIVYEGDK